MRWRNHNLLTAMAVYSITGGFLSSIVASAGAVLPDVLEIGGLIRHRTITHWPYPYLFVAGILYLWQSNTPSLTAYLMFFLALGVVLHILLDALSLTGVPVGLTPNRPERIALKIYTTFYLSEEITALGLMVVFMATAFFRGFLRTEHIQQGFMLIAELFGMIAR